MSERGGGRDRGVRQMKPPTLLKERRTILRYVVKARVAIPDFLNSGFADPGYATVCFRFCCGESSSLVVVDGPSEWGDGPQLRGEEI